MFIQFLKNLLIVLIVGTLGAFVAVRIFDGWFDEAEAANTRALEQYEAYQAEANGR